MIRSLPFHRRLRFEPLEDRRVLATITVNTLVDENNGVGVGGISLRDAIAAAMPGDTIDFSVTGSIGLQHDQLNINKSLTIHGPGANQLTIRPIIYPARVFAVVDGNDATIIDVQFSGLTISFGRLDGVNVTRQGAGIVNSENLTLNACVITRNDIIALPEVSAGGGIFSRDGRLVVNDSIIIGNTSSGIGGGVVLASGSLTVTGSTISGNYSESYSGGGIFANGSVTITGSTITGNNANSQGGGIFANGELTVSESMIADNTAGANSSGGGISANSAGIVTVFNTTLRGNSAASGGGIYRANGELHVLSSTVDDNDATNGGGIYGESSILSVNNSLISGNTAISQGGGIYSHNGSLNVSDSTLSGNSASYGGGLFGRTNTMTIERSTISGNQSQNSNGGGIESVFATLNVINSTISGNSVTGQSGFGNGGGILSYVSNTTINHSTITANYATAAGGGINAFGGSLSLNNTIVAGNFRGMTRDDISGAATASYSLIGDSTGATITNNGGSQIGNGMSPINPMLGLLASNGGPTATHVLLTGSPAIDAGDPSFSPPPSVDQRGNPFSRVTDGDGTSGAQIDIGAFEAPAQAPPGPVLPGDYNLDNVVDAADYVAWRKTLGTTGLPAYSGADGDGDTTIDDDDYDVWQENFGEMLAGAGSVAAVPEVLGLRSQSFETAETALAESNSLATGANESTARAFHFVRLDTSFRRPDSTSRLVRQPNTQFRLAESSTNELLLLAIDRIGSNRRQDLVLRDDEVDDEQNRDEEGIELRIDGPLALALAEWQ
jgi:hypothetical protein